MAGPDLSNYIEVNQRIVAFKAAHPDGSLQSKWEVVEVAGQTFIVVVGYAYRTPDDERPGMGTAWEPFPGKTPYTKQSELMVGETSAWGRAIAALGFEVKKGIASANEVRVAEARRKAPSTPEVQKLTKASKRKTLADVLTKTFNKDRDAIVEFVKSETGKDSTKDLTIEEMDKLIAEVSK